MRIALITSMKYGLTQFIFRDIEAMRNRGHDVPLFVLRAAPGLYEPPADWPVTTPSRVRAARAFLATLVRRPGLLLRLVRHAYARGTLVDLLVACDFAEQVAACDVIYAYFGDHKLFVGYYCKRLTGTPLVVTIRAYELYRNPNPAFFPEALASCDRIVTITDHNRRTLVERFGAAGDKVDIVRQIVDLDQFKPGRKLAILTVGFFAEKKGHDVLFRAFKQLGRDDVELWVVGDVNPSILQVDCRRMAEELGIGERVAFFGPQRGAALRALYRACDIFCLASRTDRYGDKEGFPNVIAEAMAFAKPVVSTRHAGIPEAIDALLADENDVDQLTEALRQACESAPLRDRLGRRNREVAERMFSGANTDALVAILERHAKHGRAPASDPAPGQKTDPTLRGTRV